MTQTKKKGNVYPAKAWKCVTKDSGAQVFIQDDEKFKRKIKKDEYYLHNEGEKYVLKTDATGAVIQSKLEEGGWEVVKEKPVDPDPDPDPDEPDPPDEPSPSPSTDGTCTWPFRKAWVLERWIWITIGTGVGCLFLALALFFLGRNKK